MSTEEDTRMTHQSTSNGAMHRMDTTVVAALIDITGTFWAFGAVTWAPQRLRRKSLTTGTAPLRGRIRLQR